MARKRHTDEDCLKLLREIELQPASESDVSGACRSVGISDATYYTWRKKLGGKPEWNFVNENDKDLAAVTHWAFLEMVCETDKLLMGSHFPLPSLGRLKVTPHAFKWLGH